jgi:hypothetical protein
MIAGFERGVNEICALLGFCTASIGSFLPDASRQHLAAVKFSQQCWWIFFSSGTFHPVDCPIYLHLQGQQSNMKALFCNKTSVTLHQSTGRNLHQHLCENVMVSHRIQDHTRPSYCVWCVFYGSVKITATFTKAPHWTYIFHSMHYILKLWLTPTSVQLCSLCKLSLTCRRRICRL